MQTDGYTPSTTASLGTDYDLHPSAKMKSANEEEEYEPHESSGRNGDPCLNQSAPLKA